MCQGLVKGDIDSPSKALCACLESIPYNEPEHVQDDSCLSRCGLR